MNSTFQHNLTLALIVSALFHILLGLNLSFYKTSAAATPTIDVEFSRQEQIVSPTEAPETAPLDTARQSDRDSSVAKESVKRGEAGSPIKAAKTSDIPALPQQKSPPPAAKQNSQPPTQQQPAPNLKLDQNTLLNQFAKTPKVVNADPLNALDPAANYQAFSRPPGSGAMFLGNGGSSDYLPSLPDGDLTLLNAKANQYAVFVRRVAVQVFAELRQVGWESLRAGDIRDIATDSIFEAVMTPDGELVEVRAVEASGSRGFDEVLRIAVKKGARDRNPPVGAQAEDGKIHFIFKAHSWVAISTNPRTQATIERRWLLLATGLL